MAGLRVVPMFGAGVYGKSAVVTRQRRVNCYYEVRPDGDKAKVVIYGTPGLQKIGTLQSALSSPTRALFGIGETQLYAVTDNQFQVLNSALVPTYSAFINTAQGLCSIAANPSASQIVTVDGVGGWVYTGGLLSALTAAWFVLGAKTITNVGGYFVTEIPNTAQFAVSNINDATSGSALSFGAAAAYPDFLLAVDNLGGNLILFCNQHMEFWQPGGAPPPAQPFLNVQSATNKWGLAAVFSRAHIAESLLFLGKSEAGTKRVCQIAGYVVTPISEEIDSIINAAGFVTSDAVALAYQVDKHPFYQLTFPSMNRSFLYDCSTGIWCEAQSGIAAGAYQRHRGNISSYYAGTTLISDYQDNRIYRMDDTTYTDDGVIGLREIITRHQTKAFNRFRIPQLYIDMETGVGLNVVENAPGFDPQISIECSKDNGRTWFPARIVGLGKQGQYIARINVRRFGQSRVFTFRIRMTEPCKFVITDAAIRVKGRGAAA